MTETKKFDKNKLKGFSDTVIEKVDCSDVWPDLGDIYVRSMTGRARDSYEAECYYAGQRAKESGVGSEMDNQRALMVICTACNEDGSPIFDMSDLQWLTEKNALALDKLVDAGQKLAGMSAKDVAEMEKSLEVAQS